jgi:hypothetical protein
MADKQPSFSERVARMRDVAAQLETITEFVTAEAAHMAAAEKRFSERRTGRREKRAR